MKLREKSTMLCWYLFAILLGLHLLGSEALAAEEIGSWRSIFDLVMRWLNFAILAFLLIKFGRTPIKDFLSNKRQTLAREIDRLEKQRKAAQQEVEQHRKMLEDSEVRLAKLKEKIVAQCEKNKEKMIQEAQQESHLMLQTARQKIENQILEAKNAIRVELIDSAVALAIKRLPEVITPEDEQKWIDRFMASTAGR